MSFQKIIFYNTDPNAGGAGGESQEGKDNHEQQLQQPEIKSLFTDDELKQFGFDSPETAKQAFVELLNKKKESEKSDEEKKKEGFIERTNFLRYAAENDLMKEDEYNQLENIKSKTDRDLVFSKFLTEFKEDNPEIKEEDFEKEAKDAFEYEYKLNDTNEKIKARGLSKIEKEAKEIKTPYESKVTTAQAKYNEEKELRAKVPEFNKFIENIIIKNTPDKVVLFKTKDGENEITIDVELTKEDRETLIKKFANVKNFNQFTKGELDAFEKTLSEKIGGWIKTNKFDAAMKKGAETFEGIGTAKGSNIGAKNSFALVKNEGRQGIEERKDNKSAATDDDVKLRQKIRSANTV